HCACGQDTYEDRVEENGPMVDVQRDRTTDEKFPNENLKNMRAAILSWRSMGEPLRTDEEVELIKARGCKPCPFWNHHNGTCNHLGCCIADSESRAILRHKMRMGTESCPIGRWSGLSGQLVFMVEEAEAGDNGDDSATDEEADSYDRDADVEGAERSLLHSPEPDSISAEGGHPRRRRRNSRRR